jgi:ferredoxin
MSKRFVFSVNSDCIACVTCSTIAPEHFDVSSGDESIVTRQPQTSDEERRCFQAKEECPVDAIEAAEVPSK